MGIHSKQLPKHLLSSYEATLREADPFRMVEKVAIQNALINQHLSEMGSLPPAEAVRTCRLTVEELGQRLEETEEPLDEGIYDAISLVQRLLKELDSSREAETQVRLLMLEQSKLVQAEASRVERSKKYLSIEQAAALVAAVVHIVNKHVSSQQEKDKIAHELISLIDRQDSDRVELPISSTRSSRQLQTTR